VARGIDNRQVAFLFAGHQRGFEPSLIEYSMMVPEYLSGGDTTEFILTTTAT